MYMFGLTFYVFKKVFKHKKKSVYRHLESQRNVPYILLNLYKRVEKKRIYFLSKIAFFSFINILTFFCYK